MWKHPCTLFLVHIWKFFLEYITRSGRTGSKLLLQFYQILPFMIVVSISPPTSAYESSCFPYPCISLTLSQTFKMFISVVRMKWYLIVLTCLSFASIVGDIEAHFAFPYELPGHSLAWFSTEIFKIFTWLVNIIYIFWVPILYLLYMLQVSFPSVWFVFFYCYDIFWK